MLGTGDVYGDLLKIAVEVADLSVGDEVRVNRGGGLFVRGPIQQIHPDGVTVRGKKYPLSVVETGEEIESRKEQNIRTLRHEEQEAARQAEQDAMRGGGREPSKPSQAPVDFSGSPMLPLLSNLKVDVRLYWQDHYDALAREWAADHSVPVGGCVANKFGERGGKVPQWGICGRVTVSMPQNNADLQVIMKELAAGGTEPQIVDNNVVVNGYRVAAGMAKAGYPAHS